MNVSALEALKSPPLPSPRKLRLWKQLYRILPRSTSVAFVYPNVHSRNAVERVSLLEQGPATTVRVANLIMSSLWKVTYHTHHTDIRDRPVAGKGRMGKIVLSKYSECHRESC